MVRTAVEYSRANLNDTLYLALTSLSMYFLFCAFPDLKKTRTGEYLSLVQKLGYSSLYIEQKKKKTKHRSLFLSSY